MEEKLSGMNFSRFSRVQDSLKNKLLEQYGQRSWRLSDDELDQVVAAGTPVRNGQEKLNSEFSPQNLT